MGEPVDLELPFAPPCGVERVRPAPASRSRRSPQPIGPRSRRSDPASSLEAAAKALPRALAHRTRILAFLVERWPAEPSSEEIARAVGLAPYDVRKRLPELEDAGDVVAINRDRLEGRGRGKPRPGEVLQWCATRAARDRIAGGAA